MLCSMTARGMPARATPSGNPASKPWISTSTHRARIVHGARFSDRLSETLRDMGVEGAQCCGFGAFGPAGPALRVPRHHVEMRPGNVGLDKLLQVECRGHRP